VHRIFSCDLFTQTDPAAAGSGSFESAYAYASGRPIFFVDPNGLCSRAPLSLFKNAILSGGKKPNKYLRLGCTELFAKMWELVTAVRTGKSGPKGLQQRFVEQMTDATEEGFKNHETAYLEARRGLNNRLDAWDLNRCDDKGGPPSSIQFANRQTIREWAAKEPPTWEEATGIVSKQAAKYTQSTGTSPGPRPTSTPYSVPWRKIFIVAAIAAAIPVLIGIAVIASEEERMASFSPLPA
jgi:hypothetical protein